MNTQDKIVKNRLGILNLAKTLGNVSKACKVMGVSRDSFYRYKELYETGGEDALRDIDRKKPCVKNRLDPEIEAAVVAFATDQPAYGQVRVSNELKNTASLSLPAVFAPFGYVMTFKRLTYDSKRWKPKRLKTI